MRLAHSFPVGAVAEAADPASIAEKEVAGEGKLGRCAEGGREEGVGERRRKSSRSQCFSHEQST